MGIFRTKPAKFESTPSKLIHCLTGIDLIFIGIGGIIGAGVFVITGVAAATLAGPAISLSYAIAGLVCLFTAFAYAELASSIGGSGGAYGYAYASMGEMIAWVIGWILLLDYFMAISVVAIGWSSYIQDALSAINISLPNILIKNPQEGGLVNLPAVFIILLLGSILTLGVKKTARFNEAAVIIKFVTIAVFIAVGFSHIKTANWVPYMPFGLTGVMGGAALVFFAFVGFDIVATAAEETRDPRHDLPIGIIGSLVICTIIYIVIALVLTGITHYSDLNVKSPIANTLLNLGHPISAGLIAVGAIAGLTSVILISIYALSRITYAIARDGLLPRYFAKLDHHTETPVRIIVIISILSSLLAGFTPIANAAELVNMGALAAFLSVCVCVIVLKITKPNMPRPFRSPFTPLFPLLGIIAIGYLMSHTPLLSWILFLSWIAVGIAIYFMYGYSHSILAKKHKSSH